MSWPLIMTHVPQVRLCGSRPNVLWQAVTNEQLRRLPDFIGLPYLEEIELCGKASYRYIRQDDPLWSALHQGVLTTGCLPQALGFYEPLAAKRLGLAKGRASHRHLLYAYQRLLLPPYVPPQERAPCTPAAEKAAEAHNAAAVARFNARRGAGAGGSGDGAAMPTSHSGASLGSCLGDPGQQQKGQQGGALGGQDGAAPAGSLANDGSSSSAAIGGGSHKKQRGRRKKATAAAAEEAAGRWPAGAVAEPGETEGPTVDAEEEQKLRLARSLAQQGCEAICCAWGTAQEPASLAALVSLLPPTSQLLEAGLCRLDAGDLPPAWGFHPGSLPPLGASPDALLRHAVPAVPVGGKEEGASTGTTQLPLPPEVYSSSGGSAGTAAAAGSGGTGAGGISNGLSPAAGAAAAVAMAAAAAALAPRAKSKGRKQAGPESRHAKPSERPASSLAGVEAGASDLSMQCSKPSSPAQNGNDCSVGGSHGSGNGDNASWPDAAIEAWCKVWSSGSSTAGSNAAEGAAGNATAGASGALRSLPPGGVEGAPGSTPQQQPQQRYILEVVEVKNACPFQQRSANKGTGSPPYLIADRGPRESVKPEWVPQLQFHMLCADTRSAVLVSRSATRGLRAFRMARDDAYLSLMLRVLSRFWREHVLARRPPPPDMFASWADYHALLTRTVMVARGAHLVLSVSDYQHPPGGDPRFFLD